MRKKYLKAVSFALIFALCFSLSTAAAHTVSSECDISDIAVTVTAPADETGEGPAFSVNAKSAVLMEVYTGTVLFDQNSDEKLPPASITKIMSLLLIMEAIDSGKISLSDTVSASEHASSMGGSQIWLEVGETMTVDELLKAAVIASANDATVALGEKISGSEEEFVRQMNKRAKELGMNDTEFKNCTGLDAEGHLTTAHDVAVMSAELIKHDLIKKYSTVWMDTLRDGESELVNTNKLVRFYSGTTGLKTGTTSNAGYCLSATAERDNTSLVAVIMGAPSSNDRFANAKKLLDHGFANYKYICVKPEKKEYAAIVKDAEEPTVNLVPSGNLSLLFKKGSSQEITQEPQIDENITAPVRKGQKLGKIIISSDNVQLGSIDLICSENLDKISLKTVLSWFLKGLFTP